MRSLGSATGETQFATVEKPVKNSIEVHDGDFVKLVSGRVTNESIGSGKLLGVINGCGTEDLVSLTVRDSVTGDSAGTKEVLVELSADNRYELATDGNIAVTDEGSYYVLTGSTGAQKVDQSSKSATVGQLLLLEFISARVGVFVVASSQFNGDAS